MSHSQCFCVVPVMTSQRSAKLSQSRPQSSSACGLAKLCGDSVQQIIAWHGVRVIVKFEDMTAC